MINESFNKPTPDRPSNPQPAQARSLTTRRINRGKAHPGNSLLPLEPRGRSKCAPRPPMKDPERDGTRLLRRWAKRLPILIGSRATRCLHMASLHCLGGGRGGWLIGECIGANGLQEHSSRPGDAIFSPVGNRRLLYPTKAGDGCGTAKSVDDVGIWVFGSHTRYLAIANNSNQAMANLLTLSIS